MNKIKTKKIVFLFAIIAFVVTCANFSYAQAGEIDQINTEIQERQKKLDKLKKQAGVYLKNINQKQKEAVSLENQLAILENKIAKTEIDIQTTEQEMEKTKLEIKDMEIQISNREVDILQKNSELTELIKLIDRSDRKSFVEILLLNDSISNFFDEVKYTKSLQADVQNSLVSVKSYKKQLEEKMETLDKKSEDLEDLKLRSEQQQIALEEELQSKELLISETQNSEEIFYNLYWQTKQEQQDASSQIYSLEREARKRLKELEKKATDNDPEADEFIPLTDSTLMWPVTNLSRGISAYFHDPEYPFRHLFEHPGIDIRAYQGTPLLAAADGYVIKARDNGYGYSYVAIMHADGLSTVYGHMSHISVRTDQYIAKGQQIGLSGGMPGTLGSGKLSTGPHLHFEVRLNGIPVNPLDYLPR